MNNTTDVENIYNTYIYQYLQNINYFVDKKTNHNNINEFLQNKHIITEQQQTFFNNLLNYNLNNVPKLSDSIEYLYSIKIENSQMIIKPLNEKFTILKEYYLLNYYICMLAVINNLTTEQKKRHN